MKVNRTLLLTYFNRYSACHLNCQFLNDKDLYIQYKGTCCPAVVCQDFKDPVCDSEGVTHENECFFNAVECLRRKTENITVTIKHKGHCEDCSQKCDDLALPVCDEVNETHSSLCKFEAFNCRLKALGHIPRKVKHIGKCRKHEETPKAAGTRTLSSDELTQNFPENTATVSSGGGGEYGSTEDHDVFASGESGFPNDTARNVLDQQPDNKDILCSAALCTKKKDPVCDNNNKTHLNMCLFKFAACKSLRAGVQLEIAYKGECSKPKVNIRREPVKAGKECAKCADKEELVPVCDNYNHTHQSICLFSNWNCEQRRANLEQRVLVHVGPCHAGSPLFNLKEEVCPTKCSRDYRPVCDSHGTTHPNLCTFQMYNCKARKAGVDDVAFLTTLHECKDVSSKHMKTAVNSHAEGKEVATTNKTFECPEPHCDNIKSPVCDSDGHVHKNECLFAWARCLAAQQGRTLRIFPEELCNISNCRLVKSENCTNDYDPICGSDFVTYPNYCIYQKAQCAQKKLEILFKGECSVCLVKPCAHLEPESDDDLFVCDQAGDTKSKCEFDMLRCIYEKKFGYNITSAYEGRCCDRLEICPAESKPVCDSNGVTHRNRCHFEVSRCRIEKIDKQKPPHEAFEGRCDDHTTTSSIVITTTTTTAPETSSEGNGQIFVSKSEHDCAGLSCPNKYAPVCGSDAITYSSVCHLEKDNCENEAEISVSYFGECCSLECPHVWRPVCDNEGTTHMNLCEFSEQRCLADRIHHKNLTIQSYEECMDSEKCGDKCEDSSRPVCASNGVTFANECHLNKANCHLRNGKSGTPGLTKEYDGECCKKSPCEYTFAPICDTSGRTHINNCVFHQEQCVAQKKFNETLKKDYDGQCCNQPCDDAYQPVCDGNVTHKNICHFRVKQCEAERQDQVLPLAYTGECCQVPTGDCMKTGPVCDSEAQTHLDFCSFEAKKCVLQRKNKTLTMVHNGECCSIEQCSKMDEPVCDNKGGTHASMCHFENTKCIYDKIHVNSTLHVKYKGKCCESSCDETWNPVCDQHGKLYTNKCHFLAKSCEIDRSTGGILLETPCSAQQTRRMLRRTRTTSDVSQP
ncbi:hypothetical protein QR680_001738 [Steinernema hermaphroditum]|uniref:Kazal-like domain-containing protein n=1 Tax=Steinernema hermaphroditum TaxID=289476 RepID=A0AA39H1B5_9BILA|nr:hypothetical protein QR680_001738 [Steinernema hermaphroditum]